MIDEPLPITYEEAMEKWKIEVKSDFEGWKKRMIDIVGIAMRGVLS